MDIAKKKIIELQEVWKKSIGESIFEEKAQAYSNRLLAFFELLIKIDRNNQK